MAELVSDCNVPVRARDGEWQEVGIEWSFSASPSGLSDRSGLTENSEASNRSLPELSLAVGCCFLRFSNRPSALRKSGIPLAHEMPAPELEG